MRVNPSSKALVVLVASSVSPARANLRAKAVTDGQDYYDKGGAIDSNDEPGPSFGRGMRDLFGSVPVMVETRCSDNHEYKLIGKEQCKPSLGGGGSRRNLKPGAGAEDSDSGCACVHTTLPPESAK